MKKRAIALILVVVPVLFLTTCSDSGTGTDSQNGGGSEEEVSTYSIQVNINPSEAGSVSPASSGTYDEGEEVELLANANEGYVFTGWSGDVESEDNPLLVTVDQDYSLTANFEEVNYSHTESYGLAANDFLAGTSFTELVVEVDYMEGYAPDPEALDSLKRFLEQRLNKTTVTIQEPTQIPSANQDSYSANEIRSLEKEHRDEFTADNSLAAYMITVDGTYTQNNVLGIAYYNTSSAYFGAAFDEVSGGIGQVSRYLVEAVTYRHEFGHLFGLVNISGSGTDMQQDHQDEENENHCDNDQCLMYYAVETTGLFEAIVGEEIPPLDQNCVNDLQDNGGR